MTFGVCLEYSGDFRGRLQVLGQEGQVEEG